MTTQQINSLFDAAKQPESPNGFSAEKFRNDVIEYLEFIDNEIAADPELAQQSHWNLVMDDGDSDYDSFFAAVIFHRDKLEVIAGTGDSYEVREVCDVHSLIEVDKLRSALMEKFGCQSLSIKRSDGELWLGRTWI